MHAVNTCRVISQLSSADEVPIPEDDQSIWSKRRKLSSHQVESREPCNLSSVNTCMYFISYLCLIFKDDIDCVQPAYTY